MSQPVFITPAGSLGTIPVGIFFQLAILAEYDEDPQAELYYKIIAGRLPDGIQCLANGVISGIPDAVASVQGIPTEVGRNTTSKWTIRVYLEEDPTIFRDRTYELTVAVIPEPIWITPAGSIGSYYDSERVDFQFEFQEVYTPDTTVVTLAAGVLPGGLRLSADGRLTGYVQPAANIDEPPGYDLTAQDLDPYDFISENLSKNYQFTLEVSNGKSSSLRTFEIFVYSRDQMQTSDDVLDVDDTFVTTDQTTYQAPFIINSEPSNIGLYRSSNYFAYQFIGENYTNQPITFAISVNQGAGLPPGITLDPSSGWYYGYIPDQGTTETEYSFNIVVYDSEFITPTISIIETSAATQYITANYITNILSPGLTLRLDQNFGGLVANTIYYVEGIISQTAIWNSTLDEIVEYQTVFTVIKSDSSAPLLTNATGAVDATLVIECTSTDGITNRISCSSTANLGIGQPIVFTGTAFGGITAAAQVIYYVIEIISDTEFKISARPYSATATNTPVALITGSGYMYANMILASEPYPFTMTITGAVEGEVIWNTPADLGSIVNGSVSMLKVSATNRGGRTMKYRLASGDYNLLPQGLQLISTGDIVGRVSFNTFAIDNGLTTFDQSFEINRNLASLGTTFDLVFEFTVNAYAEDLNQTVYAVDRINVVSGGSGYSSINTPTIVIGQPVGASAVPAEAGMVTVVGGEIIEVEVSEGGNGYTTTPSVTITQGFGGSNAVLEAVMRETGSRDVISVFKTFRVRLIREYNRPYQNLYVRAMPSPQDRALLRSLLENQEIFPPQYLYRPEDPNFGKSTQVTYAHAFGLAPDTLERYVSSLYENHYWKNLILGAIETAQAIDPVTGQVLYEVVYSKIIDTLVNSAGESVSKIVTLPYAITDPADGSTLITSVYPNSLVNMRDQVIDVVGQISNVLPLWMTSKQTNGRVLGFTPAWVIAYVQPGRAREVAYYIRTYFAQPLNSIDFKVDRYILDRKLSQNWDTETQRWIPRPPTLTTFDRFNTGGLIFYGQVNICTNLAYSDVYNRSLDYINGLGGLDGIINNVEGKTIIFAKQEDYDGPPGSAYATTDEGWQEWQAPFGGVPGIPATYYDNLALDVSNTIPNMPVNERMAIYTITINPLSGCLDLVLTAQPTANDYVQVIEGTFYRSSFLYYPTIPAQGLTEISWQFVTTVVTDETVFDGNSLKFITPVDMYDPTDTYDKYLVFPKSNILV